MSSGVRRTSRNSGGAVVSSEFRVRIQTSPQNYKSLPMDGELAAELADAMWLVRETVEAEARTRDAYPDKATLKDVQRSLDSRREAEERCVELFKVILGDIPSFLASLPDYSSIKKRRATKAA